MRWVRGLPQPSLHNSSHSTPFPSSRRVIDAFPFHNEIDLLEVRLNELNDSVDAHILVESTFTQFGEPKRLYFSEAVKSNPNRFSPFMHKIVHVVVGDKPPGFQSSTGCRLGWRMPSEVRASVAATHMPST